jgi:hypothetical protein
MQRATPSFHTIYLWLNKPGRPMCEAQRTGRTDGKTDGNRTRQTALQGDQQQQAKRVKRGEKGSGNAQGKREGA